MKNRIEFEQTVITGIKPKAGPLSLSLSIRKQWFNWCEMIIIHYLHEANYTLTSPHESPHTVKILAMQLKLCVHAKLNASDATSCLSLKISRSRQCTISAETSKKKKKKRLWTHRTFLYRLIQLVPLLSSRWFCDLSVCR